MFTLNESASLSGSLRQSLSKSLVRLLHLSSEFELLSSNNSMAPIAAAFSLILRSTADVVRMQPKSYRVQGLLFLSPIFVSLECAFMVIDATLLLLVAFDKGLAIHEPFIAHSLGVRAFIR